MLQGVTAQTPYDDDRRRYSRTALARLVLAHRARGLSETAANLAVTRYDEFCGAGGRVSEASTLTALADLVLTSAAVYERERGSSWADIGGHLGVSGAAAEERFTPAVDEWRNAFEVPYRLDETGRKRIPQLPTAAYDPRRVSRNLDLWAHVHLGLGDKHAVSGGLEPHAEADPDAWPVEPVRDEIDGRIERRHLETFLALVAHYIHHQPEDGAWDAVTRALAEGDSSYAMVGIFETLGIRMSRVRDSDVVSVVVADARAADLRLRISTLLDAFADS